MVLPRSCDSDGKIWACSLLLNNNVPTCVRSPLLEKSDPSEFKFIYFQDECRCSSRASSQTGDSSLPRAGGLGALTSKGRARPSLSSGPPTEMRCSDTSSRFQGFPKTYFRSGTHSAPHPLSLSLLLLFSHYCYN